MPMEVFTISGPAGFGDAAPPCLLQTALKALGAAHGDPTLSAVATDGAIGPKTVSALNLALGKYIGAENVQSAALGTVAGGRFMNATANKNDVQQYAGTLATLVSDSVKSAGGTVPAASCTRGGGGGAVKSKNPFATQPTTNASDNTMNNPNLVWVLGGGALIVLALGFMAARKRAA